ncbi:MAG TPA: DUF4157 domain-containing protein [Pyrinomonadaceae bacterium]|nr:DUF4157 domain-containing protein [Pyrinomonadaceae bacterium]
MREFAAKENNKKSDSTGPASLKKATRTSKLETPANAILQLQKSIGNHAVGKILRSRARDDGGGLHNENSVCQTASDGIAGTPQPLPHLKAIQQSFGHHDVSAVQAHIDPQATAANRELDSVGYTIGNHVAFVGNPDLHTAAHEAAHVVQQQAGVHLTGRVGRAGDEYERHADEVADRVVQSRSAETLLDRRAGSVESGKTASAAGLQKQSPANQMQRAPESTSKSGGISKAELLQQGFQKLLNEEQLNEKINGAAAAALAKAYLAGRAVKLGGGMRATPYLAEKLPTPPTEDEVYRAILSGMDIANSSAVKVGKNWKLRAAPQDEGREETAKVVFDWAVEQGVDYVMDKAKEKAIKKGAAWCAARWTAAEGLVVVAEMVLGALNVVGDIALAASFLALLIELQRPEKQISKREQILGDVKSWLAGQQAEAAEAKKSAQEAAAFAERFGRPFKPDMRPAAPVDATRVGK